MLSLKAETICVCRPRGSQISGATSPLMPEKPAGETPMIVCGLPLTRSVLPTKSGLPPIRCQRLWLAMTTGMLAFGRASSGVKNLPAAGWAPMNEKKLSETTKTKARRIDSRSRAIPASAKLSAVTSLNSSRASPSAVNSAYENWR